MANPFYRSKRKDAIPSGNSLGTFNVRGLSKSLLHVLPLTDLLVKASGKSDSPIKGLYFLQYRQN